MQLGNAQAQLPGGFAAPKAQVDFVRIELDGVKRRLEELTGETLTDERLADGVIRAAFDACDVCWPAGKGYVQEGDQMICRNCGRRFDSVRINEVKGGCNPAPLQRRIQGDTLVITVNDIRSGMRYFNFGVQATS